MVGGQAVAQRSTVLGLFRTDTGAQFSSNLVGSQSLTGIPVAAADVVEFRVATQTYYGHFLGIEENITLTVPEAGSLALFAAGAFCRGLLRRGSRAA